jgi:hypothetical protein
LLFRVRQPDRQASARKALTHVAAGDSPRHRLQTLVRAFLGALPHTKPAIAADVQEALVALADVVTRARSGVLRDGSRREMLYHPEPEMPARFVVPSSHHL